MAQQARVTYFFLKLIGVGGYLYFYMSLESFWHHMLIGITLILYHGNLMTDHTILLEMNKGDLTETIADERLLEKRGLFMLSNLLTGCIFGVLSYGLKGLLS